MRFPTLEQNTYRYLSILTTLIATLALMVLAAGLHSLEFEPARQFGFYERPGGLTTGIIPFNLDRLMRAFIIFTSVTFVVGIILLVVSPEARKTFWRYFRPILILLTIYAAMVYFSRPTEGEVEEPLATQFAPPVEVGDEPELEAAKEVPYSAPEAEIWQRYLIGASIIILIGVAGYAIWQKYKSSEDEFVEITRTALSDIHSGRDWEDAVIQCYVRMNNAIRQQKHLNRNQSMTPREFASHLGRSGLPEEPVINLTRLFEKARYGSYSSGTDERTEAIDCLTNILDAIQETV